jgi:hypothetical protein
MEAYFKNPQPASRLIICTMSFPFSSLLSRNYLILIELFINLEIAIILFSHNQAHNQPHNLQANPDARDVACLLAFSNIMLVPKQ